MFTTVFCIGEKVRSSRKLHQRGIHLGDFFPICGKLAFKVRLNSKSSVTFVTIVFKHVPKEVMHISHMHSHLFGSLNMKITLVTTEFGFTRCAMYFPVVYIQQMLTSKFFLTIWFRTMVALQIP